MESTTSSSASSIPGIGSGFLGSTEVLPFQRCTLLRVEPGDPGARFSRPAGDPSSAGQNPIQWRTPGADAHRVRAPRVEPTAARRLDQVGRGPGDVVETLGL